MTQDKKEQLTASEKMIYGQKRASELKETINDYLEVKDKIPTGFRNWEEIKERQEKIKSYFGATQEDWDDWHWQVKNRIDEVEVLKEFLDLTAEEINDIDAVGSRYRWAVSPYYLSLMDPNDSKCPIRRQAIPTGEELIDSLGKDDPMGEEYTSPAPSITRRYPDRLIINMTNQCAMYCRHCQRRRNIGEVDQAVPKKEIEKALEYIRNNEEIRDVLLTGGDALMASNNYLDWILTELDNIPHVEMKRLGSRTLVTMPQRVTKELCDMLEKHAPVYINTHYNHPLEITPRAKEATQMLTKAGVPVANQAVLLAGVNNDPMVMKKLNHELLKVLVRPYYIFHAKSVKGTAHFRTRVEEGIEIMEKLRGYTSGMAIPTFIVNAPSGFGKTPMLPEYLVSMGKDKIVLRTWENKVFDYENDE